jgi:hypothetical protein
MLLFGDIPRVDIFLAGDALGEGEGDALGDVDDLGAAFDAVSKLVGLFRLGDPCACNPLVPGDFERLLGEFGMDSMFPLAGGCAGCACPPQQLLSPFLEDDIG